MEDECSTGVSELVSILNNFDQRLYKNERRVEDMYGLTLLQNLILGFPNISRSPRQ
jgi:hypothetical protein